nr:diguanylate cyclase [uncultured Dethiosulfovibrio sp.]
MVLEEYLQNPFKVVIASDSRLERSILVDGIERAFDRSHNYIVEMCSRGDDALERIISTKPDMVFIDWVLPGMEGPEVCHKVRSTNKDNDQGYCYIFITTSKGDRKSIVHGLSSGADDFITKPFDTEEMNARISVGIRFIRAYRELWRQKEEIDKLSRTDVLTGNLNRRSIMSILGSVLEKSQRNNNPVAICLCDIDFFKKINDTYGHQAGDFILAQVGILFDEVAVNTGAVGRYGGDEFLFLFPGMDFFSVAKVIKKLYDRVKKEIFVFDGIPLKVSLSCGVAYLSCFSGKSLWTSGGLIKVADDALYEAKRRGKGRACSCDGIKWSEKQESDPEVFQDLA